MSALFLAQCQPAPRTHAWFAMDSNFSVTVYGRGRVPADTLFAALERLAATWEGVCTDFAPASGLARLRARAGDTVALDPRLAGVLARSLAGAEESGGAFDITLHDLKSVWGLGSGQVPHLPSPREIDSAMAGNPHYRAPASPYRPPLGLLPGPGGWRAVILRGNAGFDLGAIAKGALVDAMDSLATASGYPDHFLQAGGEIRLGGHKPAGPWRIGIRHPRRADTLCATLATASGHLAISTSGDYERFFDLGGKRYHHIFDPATGYPSDSACAVTVITDTSAESDLLSTTLFVLGPGRGRTLARRHRAFAIWFRAMPAGVCALPPETGGRTDVALDLGATPACPP